MALVKNVFFLVSVAFIAGFFFSKSVYDFDPKDTMIEIPKNLPQNQCSIIITHDNINQFYDEYYRFYELNQQWQLKTFLGIQFMQNPNDAITIAEILHQQNIDLVIETGSHLGASALFFASILYQSHYDTKINATRPFRIITMDISPAAREYIDKYPLLSSFITFIPHGSLSPIAQTIVNETYNTMKPKNVFITLDGDHYAETVYLELVHYQKYLPTIGNIIVAQDARLSSKWHSVYCSAAKFDGPCNGPREAVDWFLKNEGQGRFMVDSSKEYLFSTHHRGWLKKIA